MIVPGIGLFPAFLYVPLLILFPGLFVCPSANTAVPAEICLKIQSQSALPKDIEDAQIAELKGSQTACQK